MAIQTGKPYFIGKEMKQIWKRLSNIKPPHYIGRLPKDLEKLYANFKATKIQVWLLLYGIPCMEDILSYQFLNHFSQLAEGVCLGDSIITQEMARAEALLQSFYVPFEALYNPGSRGLKMHNCGVESTLYSMCICGAHCGLGVTFHLRIAMLTFYVAFMVREMLHIR